MSACSPCARRRTSIPATQDATTLRSTSQTFPTFRSTLVRLTIFTSHAPTAVGLQDPGFWARLFTTPRALAPRCRELGTLASSSLPERSRTEVRGRIIARRIVPRRRAASCRARSPARTDDSLGNQHRCRSETGAALARQRNKYKRRPPATPVLCLNKPSGRKHQSHALVSDRRLQRVRETRSCIPARSDLHPAHFIARFPP